MARKTTKPATKTPWSQLPALLQEPAANRWHSFLEAARAAGARVPADAAFQACICRVFAASDEAAATAWLLMPACWRATRSKWISRR